MVSSTYIQASFFFSYTLASDNSSPHVSRIVSSFVMTFLLLLQSERDDGGGQAGTSHVAAIGSSSRGRGRGRGGGVGRGSGDIANDRGGLGAGGGQGAADGGRGARGDGAHSVADLRTADLGADLAGDLKSF